MGRPTSIPSTGASASRSGNMSEGRGRPQRWSDSEILDDLRRCSKLVEGNLSHQDYTNIGKISHATVTSRFETWNNAKEAAGLETVDRHDGISNERKAKRLETIKTEIPCDRCGNNYLFPAMDFHHRDPSSKRFNMCPYRRWREIEEELRKCDILCANCHRIVEYENNNK